MMDLILLIIPWLILVIFCHYKDKNRQDSEDLEYQTILNIYIDGILMVQETYTNLIYDDLKFQVDLYKQIYEYEHPGIKLVQDSDFPLERTGPRIMEKHFKTVNLDFTNLDKKIELKKLSTFKYCDYDGHIFEQKPQLIGQLKSYYCEELGTEVYETEVIIIDDLEDKYELTLYYQSPKGTNFYKDNNGVCWKESSNIFIRVSETKEDETVPKVITKSEVKILDTIETTEEVEMEDSYIKDVRLNIEIKSQLGYQRLIGLIKLLRDTDGVIPEAELIFTPNGEDPYIFSFDTSDFINVKSVEMKSRYETVFGSTQNRTD